MNTGTKLMSALGFMLLGGFVTMTIGPAHADTALIQVINSASTPTGTPAPQGFINVTGTVLGAKKGMDVNVVGASGSPAAVIPSGGIPTSTPGITVLSVAQTPLAGPTVLVSRYEQLVWVNSNGAPTGALVNYAANAAPTTGPGLLPGQSAVFDMTVASQQHWYVSNSATPTIVVIESYAQ